MLYVVIALCIQWSVLVVSLYWNSPNPCFVEAQHEMSLLYILQIIVCTVLLVGCMVLSLIERRVKNSEKLVDIIQTYQALCIIFVFVSNCSLIWVMVLTKKCVDNFIELFEYYPHAVLMAGDAVLIFLLITFATKHICILCARCRSRSENRDNENQRSSEEENLNNGRVENTELVISSEKIRQ